METDGRTDERTDGRDKANPLCNGGIITTSSLIEYIVQVVIFFIIDLLFFLVFI